MTARPSPVTSRRLTTLLALALALTTIAVAGPAAGSPGDATTDATTGMHGTADLARAASVQRKVDEAHAAYEAAGLRVAALSAQVARLTATAERAESVATQLRARVSGQQGGFFHAVGELVDSGVSDLDLAAEAADNAAQARRLVTMAQQALGDAITATEQARTRWESAQRHQAAVEAKWDARELAGAAIRRSQPTTAYDVTDAAQDQRNRRALHSWETYLRRLGSLSVVPPDADRLADLDRLPPSFQPARSAREQVVPGVAQVASPGQGLVTVLPSETVSAVSEAFHLLGQPDVPSGATSTAYACGGLIAHAWSATGLTFPVDAAAQWEQLPRVPRDSIQVGDLVLLGNRATGLERTGVYVGDGRAIVADASTGAAGVEPLPASGLLGVRRPTLPAGGTNPGLPGGGACAPTTVTETTDGSGPLTVPVDADLYHLSAGFGDDGLLWSSGEHSGQDFAAPIGTPVVAAASGVVTIEHPDWAGNLVRIDHGGGVETWYAHLSRVDVLPGQTVSSGQQVGAVGDLGNTTGPHLHFEVRLDGEGVDPTEVLDLPEHPRTAFTNGEAPTQALCTATPDGAQLLRCDAAVAYRLLADAFEGSTGTPLCITDSYRSRLGQERVFAAKPHLAASPGTSVHGWGRAVDLCGGVERFGTAENTWLLAHGPAFGWNHPSWAAAGGSRPEPWHFE
ncbi:MAG: peptidase, partial [Nocardioides sp.]|nr:peptidase [Nocardioides sp.]